MAKILIVDDMASMRKMVAFTLESAGHDVVQADDGDVALAIAQEQTGFALVITDVNMPNMDGITLTRELRGLPALKFIPNGTINTAMTKPNAHSCKVSLRPCRP